MAATPEKYIQDKMRSIRASVNFIGKTVQNGTFNDVMMDKGMKSIEKDVRAVYKYGVLVGFNSK